MAYIVWALWVYHISYGILVEIYCRTKRYSSTRNFCIVGMYFCNTWGILFIVIDAESTFLYSLSEGSSDKSYII